MNFLKRFFEKDKITIVSTAVNRKRLINFANELKKVSDNPKFKDYSVKKKPYEQINSR